MTDIREAVEVVEVEGGWKIAVRGVVKPRGLFTMREVAESEADFYRALLAAPVADPRCPHCGHPTAEHGEHGCKWGCAWGLCDGSGVGERGAAGPDIDRRQSELRAIGGDALIEEAERLDREATKGPWVRCCAGANGDGCGGGFIWFDEGAEKMARVDHSGGGEKGVDDQDRANAEFIARARTLVPQLSAALRLANERGKAMEAVVEAAIQIKISVDAMGGMNEAGVRVHIHRVLIAALFDALPVGGV